VRLHSSSYVVLKTCHIFGCKEQLIIVAVMHCNVKLQSLECLCLFLDCASLLEVQQAIDCCPEIISSNFA
jgi:hypothetical protein